MEIRKFKKITVQHDNGDVKEYLRYNENEWGVVDDECKYTVLEDFAELEKCYQENHKDKSEVTEPIEVEDQEPPFIPEIREYVIEARSDMYEPMFDFYYNDKYFCVLKDYLPLEGVKKLSIRKKEYEGLEVVVLFTYIFKVHEPVSNIIEVNMDNYTKCFEEMLSSSNVDFYDFVNMVEYLVNVSELKAYSIGLDVLRKIKNEDCYKKVLNSCEKDIQLFNG